MTITTNYYITTTEATNAIILDTGKELLKVVRGYANKVQCMTFSCLLYTSNKKKHLLAK